MLSSFTAANLATRALSAAASTASIAAVPTQRYGAARRQLAKKGIEALKAQKVVLSENSVLERTNHWRKPVISRRVAQVLRKDAIKLGTYGKFDLETLTGWDPEWDEALKSKDLQGRHRIQKPKSHKRERTRADRIAKIDANMEGMTQRMEELMKTQRDNRQRKMDFQSVFKRASQVK
jgi:Mitochondrial ribosomal protein mL59